MLLLFSCQLATLGLLRQTPSYSLWRAEIEAYPTLSLWLARVLSVIVLVAAIAVVRRGTRPLDLRRMLGASGIMLMTGATVTLYASSSLPVYLAGQILIGSSHAWVLACWADLLSRLKATTRNHCIALSALIAVVLFTLVGLAPWPFRAPIFLAITLGSIVPLLSSRYAAPSEPTSESSHAVRRASSRPTLLREALANLPAELIILMASYAMVFRILVFFDFPVHDEQLRFVYASLLRIGGMALLLAYMARTRFEPSTRQIIFPLLFLTVVGVALLPLSSEFMSSISVAIIESSWTFFYTIMWLVLFELGKGRDKDPLFAFLGGWTVMNTLLLAAAPLAALFKTQVSEGVLSLTALALVIVYMLSVGMLLLRKRPIPCAREEEALRAPGWKEGQEAYFRATAHRYGLTKRETDVFELLVQGYSLPAIEERFVLSHSTVKGHARNVYRKFKVDNKQELIELVNRLRTEESVF